MALPVRLDGSATIEESWKVKQEGERVGGGRSEDEAGAGAGAWRDRGMVLVCRIGSHGARGHW